MALPVFRGTRLPMHFLFGHLSDGVNLDEFLVELPVCPEREQAVRAIQLGGLLLEAMAYECTLAETGDSSHPPGQTASEGPGVPQVESPSPRSFTRPPGWAVPRPCRRSYAAAGADPNSYSIRRYGGTALHKAARQGHVDTVRSHYSRRAPIPICARRIGTAELRFMYSDLVRRPRNHQSVDRRR